MVVGATGVCKQCQRPFRATSNSQKFCTTACCAQWNCEHPEIDPKLCKKCKVRKPLSQFYFKNDSGTYNKKCKACCLDSVRTKRKAKPESKQTPAQVRANTANKLRNYGLKPADYDEMLKEQQGVCAICQQPERTYNKRLAVDHCHATGEVRGLLCSRCNSGIGYLGDTVERLIAAVSYLGKNDYLEELIIKRAEEDYHYNRYEIARGK